MLRTRTNAKVSAVLLPELYLAFQRKRSLLSADTPLVPVSRLLTLVRKKIGQHAVAVGLSAAMLASCLSAGASEVMR